MMAHRYCAWIAAVTVLGWSTGATAAGPVSPYRALGLPHAIHPALTAAPVQTITAGSLNIQLEVTRLSAVKKQFGGVVRGSGDAANAATWLCYAGKDSEGTAVVFWFISNDEMSGNLHEITQVAVQSNPTEIIPSGCGAAPAELTRIDFGVPSIGATLDAVAERFGAAKPDARGYIGYASEVAVQQPKEFTMLQSVQYRIRGGKVTTVSVSQVTTN